MKHNTILLDLTVLGALTANDEIEITDKKLLKQFELLSNYSGYGIDKRPLPLVIVRYYDIGNEDTQHVVPCELLTGQSQLGFILQYSVGLYSIQFKWEENAFQELRLFYLEA